MILAIDPGPEQSAFVLYDDDRRGLDAFGKVPNDEILGLLQNLRARVLVVEMIASYGMPVGREVFETCMWIGRFVERWPDEYELLYRAAVKMHLCGTMRAKDANVRAALMDAWGGKEKAMGTKKQPGPLHGVKGDVWAALGVAVTYADRQEQARAA